jgi:hypothetical protein
MMKHLGGPHQISLLRNLLLIKFLESLATGGGPEQEEKIAHRIDARLKALASQAEQVPLVDAKKVVREEIGKLTGIPFPTKDVEEQEFFKNINRIANSRRFPLDAGTLVERYTKARIFNLGVRVQCSVCDQRSWYPLELVKSELQCPICLSQFELPTHNPRNEIKWSYKSLGPFALPKQGFGAYSVLLTVAFLSDWHDPATTPIFSFRATHLGKELEADFMMFYRSATYWERETETIFGECKSFNGFTEKDIRRMTALAEDNPDAILVFATLASQFSDRDKRLLTPFVKRRRKYAKLDRPKNPVLLLTGTELFSDFGPPQCWRDAGAQMKAFADSGRQVDGLLTLCDATQQLHLGLPSWHEDWTAAFDRRRKKKKPQPAPAASSA